MSRSPRVPRIREATIADTPAPATDSEIAEKRDHPFAGPFHKRLIARIDLERARVTKLEAAARELIEAMDSYPNKPIDDDYWRAVYLAKAKLSAALAAGLNPGPDAL